MVDSHEGDEDVAEQEEDGYHDWKLEIKRERGEEEEEETEEKI